MVNEALVIDLVNTRRTEPLPEGGEQPVEELHSLPALTGWLAAHGVLAADGEANARDLGDARDLRDALLQLLLANNDVDVDRAAPEAVLDRIAHRAALEPRFVGGVHLQPAAPGVTGALGRVVAVVYGSMADGSWPRLKACRGQACGWAFLDTTKNRSRAWCSMSVCGNRAKVRSYRERRRPAG
jgi:predicted RNA-binding Zn ribbon-like protein